MNGEKVTLLSLAFIFIILLFFPPAFFQKIGSVLNFGFSNPVKLMEGNISALQVSVRPFLGKNMILADVYSRYPLNFKNELLVNAGQNDNIKINGAAIFDGILVGRVRGVGEKTSVVQTVFDPGFNLPVRIGKSKADALLAGGVEPRLTMIQKNAEVSPGDLVYSASQDLEYGLLIGSAGTPVLSGSSVFSEAPLVLGYNPADMRFISLETK